MKISVACILVFICCILYCSLGTTQSTSSSEDTVEVNSYNVPETTTENGTSKDDVFVDRVTIPDEGNFESYVENSEETEKAASLIEESVYQQENAFLEVAQNSGVAHEIASPGLETIHTLVDTATLELKEKAEELSATPITDTSHFNTTPNLEDNLIPELDVHQDELETIGLSQERELDDSEIDNQTEEFLQKVPSSEPKINITEPKGDTNEDIPSFSEWAQKQLQEAERKKEEVNASVQNHAPNGKSSLSGKKRWKNYASPDCGAKIIAANPEAISPGSVLSTSRDEYKLNACTSRIWFVVELCEAIQAKKIDLANFELFSSSPKDFSISVSDRFPSREWSSVGHFTAKDERDIQSFDLYPHLFGKFIKFEMHSHHGSEHYCPISLFRVYGTSEFEVLETENQVHVAEDDDDDETLDSSDGVPTKNLFSSATDAVISIVKKAAEVLANKGNHSKAVELEQNKTHHQYLPLIRSCTTPSHVIVCENCSDLLFGYVFELLSCKSPQLRMLLNAPVIRKTLYNTDVCSSFGLIWQNEPTMSLPDIYKNFLTSFFAPKYVAAMCNKVAIVECKVVLNISSNATIIPPNIENIVGSRPSTIIPNITLEIPTIEPIEFASVRIESPTSDIPVTPQIKPTRTLSPEENLNIVDPSDLIKDDKSIESTGDASQNGKTDNVTANEDNIVAPEVDQMDLNIATIPSDSELVSESSDSLDEHLESLVNELNGESTLAPVTTASPPAHQQQKESVFLRLSNRLKALELNMSLSGQYLEELSRRYKKQVEEMQRSLDKTIITLSEDNKKKEERADRLEQQINSLKETVELLIEERNSWLRSTYWLTLLATFLGTWLFCRRNTNSKQSTINCETKNTEVLRRNSIDVVSHKTPPKKKRRPSEEALLVNGTYKDLLLDNVSKPKKRKKRKPKLCKSNSVTTLTEEATDHENSACKTVNSETGLYFAPKATSSQILNRQTSLQLRLPSQWVDKSTYTHNEIQDPPFVLEESEHSSLEPLSHSLFGNEDKSFKRAGFKKNNNSNHIGYTKPASSDESKTTRTPSPVIVCETSPNGTLPDDSYLELPRREKKNFLKKIFKNFTFK